MSLETVRRGARNAGEKHDNTAAAMERKVRSGRVGPRRRETLERKIARERVRQHMAEKFSESLEIRIDIPDSSLAMWVEEDGD